MKLKFEEKTNNEHYDKCDFFFKSREIYFLPITLIPRVISWNTSGYAKTSKRATREDVLMHFTELPLSHLLLSVLRGSLL